MDSWLKAAEGLFEVVDRRAKLVAGELVDVTQSTAPNGEGSQTRRKNSKPKVQNKLFLTESPVESGAAEELTNNQTSQSDVSSDKDRVSHSVENEGTKIGDSIAQTSTEQKNGVERDTSSIQSSETLASEVVKHDIDNGKIPVIATEVEAAASASNGKLLDDQSSNIPVEHPVPALLAKATEVAEEEHRVDIDQNIKSRGTEVPPGIEQERSDPGGTDSSISSGTPVKDTDSLTEPFVDQKKQEEPKANSSPMNIQDQLDEAQGLLKTAISTGQSKEARLARVCAGLSTRLQEYKTENKQLEELLVAERELSKSYEAHIKQLQQDLSTAKNEVTRVESSMLEALAAKNSEIEKLVSSMDALKKQAALSEGNMASLQMFSRQTWNLL